MRLRKKKMPIEKRVASTTITIKCQGQNIIGPMTLENLYLMVKWGGMNGQDVLEEGLHNSDHIGMIITLPTEE